MSVDLPAPFLHAVEGLHERRLARAVLAHDRVHLAAPDPQLDVAVGDDTREPLGDAAQLDREGRVSGRGGAAGLGTRRGAAGSS
jgi:hypothetical protein